MTRTTQTMFTFSKATASAVRSAFGKAAKIEESAREAREAAGQRLVDELLMLCDTPDREAFFTKVKARAACMEVFSACAGLSESAVKNYPTSVKLAFIHDVKFNAFLFTHAGKVSAGIPTPEKADSEKKAGAVVKTTKESTFKTARKLLEQLRLIECDDCAAAVLDAMLDGFEDFAETEAADI